MSSTCPNTDTVLILKGTADVPYYLVLASLYDKQSIDTLSIISNRVMNIRTKLLPKVLGNKLLGTYNLIA